MNFKKFKYQATPRRESFIFYAQLHEVVILHTPETKKLSVFDSPGIKTDLQLVVHLYMKNQKKKKYEKSHKRKRYQ